MVTNWSDSCVLIMQWVFKAIHEVGFLMLDFWDSSDVLKVHEVGSVLCVLCSSRTLSEWYEDKVQSVACLFSILWLCERKRPYLWVPEYFVDICWSSFDEEAFRRKASVCTRRCKNKTHERTRTFMQRLWFEPTVPMSGRQKIIRLRGQFSVIHCRPSLWQWDSGTLS